MWLYWVGMVYVIVGAWLSGVFWTDAPPRDTLEKLLCLSVIPLWPLWSLAMGIATFCERRDKKRKEKKDQTVYFLRTLNRMHLLSRKTLLDIVRNYLA